MASLGMAVALFFHVLIFSVTWANSAKFTIVNGCSFKVWPGILSGAGTEPLSTTGFALDPGASNSVAVPASWSGRLWGRTFCSQDAATGKFACLTGDCGSSALDCSGSGGAPPATLAEFTLNGAGGLDFYDVSLVDGYNLPMLVVPQGTAASSGAGNCTATGCAAELNVACPQELKVTSKGSEGGGVACRSACGAFGDPQYCCSGAHGTPDTCGPSRYSEFFKSACPKAYSYAYDDGTSTFTCASADYEVTFCPTPSARVMAAGGEYEVAADVSGGVSSSWTPPLSVVAIVVSAAVWQLRQPF